MTYIKELEGSIGYSKSKKKEAPITTRSVKMASELSSQNKEMVKIMQSMLSLNPFFRLSAFEAVVHSKVFDPFRNK